MHKPLILGGVEFKSRLFLGTGKFSSAAALKAAIEASGTELVTVAMRRVDLNKQERDDILGAIDRSKVKIMLNTSGARTAEDAVKIARFGKDFFQWIKLEIHPDPIHLLPDPIETLKAAEILVKEGFIVLPYINADPVLAKRLEDVGVHAVMPLGAQIGSGQGIRTEAMLEIIIEDSNVPVVIDAGLGLPSHAAQAIEMGADAEEFPAAFHDTPAVAAAGDPVKMAKAFAMAVESAELGIQAQPAPMSRNASASSPSDIFSSPI